MAPPLPFPHIFAGLPRGVASPSDNSNPQPTSPPRGSPGDILLHAAFDGNLRLVKKMARALDDGEGRLAEKVEAVRDSNGANPLHLAASRARLPVCRYLVEELGLDVNAAACIDGETPLWFAIMYESVDMVRYLLDHGVDIEKVNNGGLTPLQLASALGLCEIVRLLLSKGASINALTACGTALHCACHSGRDGVVKILLDHHADHSIKAWGTYTPLVIAVYARSLGCVKLFIEAGADVQGGVVDETPLMVAVVKGFTDILKCLVEAGADPNAHDFLGHTPTEIAAHFGNREDVEILFPLTSRIPGVSEWSVDGIISYANSRPLLKFKDLEKRRLAGAKLQGREAVKNKDYLAAMHIYTEAMNFAPDDATLYANRSLCWLHLGEGGKALMDAQACRALQPNWSKACYREGAALMLMKKYEKACDAFLDALKLEPGNIETRNALREAMESLKISQSTAKE